MILFYFYKIKNTLLFLKKYFIGYLIFLLIVFFLSTYVVKALETGEIWSESATRKYQLGNFVWGYGDFPLYGLNGDGSTSYSPKLDTFYNAQNSLFTYDGSVNLNNTRAGYAMRFYLNKTLMSGNSYDMSIKFGGNSTDLSYYFSNPSGVNGMTLNQHAFTCSNDICTLTINVKPNSNLSVVYIDFNNPGDGLNGYYVNQIIKELYFPQIQSTSSFDTSGIESRQNQIIDQNQTIINQNEKTNEQLEKNTEEQKKTNDTLTDSDTSSATEEGSSFFNDFSTTDHGGISSIVTAPLTAINKMLESSCSPLSATWKGKTISLPCGYDFWDKMGEIKTFLNVAIGGLLCYRIILKMYLLIEKLKNPDNDRVEVMKL